MKTTLSILFLFAALAHGQITQQIVAIQNAAG